MKWYGEGNGWDLGKREGGGGEVKTQGAGGGGGVKVEGIEDKRKHNKP